MTFRFHELANRELSSSAEWYESRSSGLGAEFIEEVDRAIARVLEDPETFAFYDGDVRRCPVRRFPFHLLYRVHESVVEIVAVMHVRRRRGFWRNR